MSTQQDETGQSPCPVCGIREWGIIAPGLAACVCGHEFADPDEEIPADLELARLRLRQAQERIRNRFPAAARDGKLASILSGLEDALGQGSEAAEPEADELSKGTLLTPDLLVACDGSANVVLVSRREAAEWLIRRGYTRDSALRATEQIRTGQGWPGSQAQGMTYDGTYWRVPAEESS